MTEGAKLSVEFRFKNKKLSSAVLNSKKKDVSWDNVSWEKTENLHYWHVFSFSVGQESYVQNQNQT